MMRLFMATMPLLLVAGCVTGDLKALCDATVRDRDLASAAAAEEGTDAVVTTIQPLISKIDSACR